MTRSVYSEHRAAMANKKAREAFLADLRAIVARVGGDAWLNVRDCALRGARHATV